jgi:hypothetical protein
MIFAETRGLVHNLNSLLFSRVLCFIQEKSSTCYFDLQSSIILLPDNFGPVGKWTGVTLVRNQTGSNLLSRLYENTTDVLIWYVQMLGLAFHYAIHVA